MNNPRQFLLSLLRVGVITAGILLTPSASAGTATLNLVFVLDGLRPDSISEAETPNLWRLRRDGVNFVNGHSVFPTVTRVNATGIGSGVYPSRNGIFGNSLYVREVDPNHSFVNDDHKELLRLDAATHGAMVLSKSLGEYLAEQGKTLAVVSSGSTGGSLLANPRATRGIGVLINGYWEPGRRVGFPDAVNAEILRRFPAAPVLGGARDNHAAAVSWTEGVLRDYVIPELKPEIIINWLTEPDHIQHAMGVGSPEGRAAIANDDREIGLVLDRLRALGLEGKTNIIVVSDHGFGHTEYGVNLTGELIKAGLKAGPDSDDVVLASSGQAVALHVRNRDAGRIGRIVRFLQHQVWTDTIFTAARPGSTGVAIEGREKGTFSLELVHLAHAQRGPDIVLGFPWNSETNRFGVPGRNYGMAGTTGAIEGSAGSHGSLSPWTVNNTFIAWGPDFKKGITLRTPSSNVDVAPTLIALMNLDKKIGLDNFDGRVLSEAFAGGPEAEKLPVQLHTYFVETADHSYRAALQVTDLDKQRYIDKGWRIR